MSRIPGTYSEPKRGREERMAICPDCLHPVCAYCGRCTKPVWALDVGVFQCDCGYTGELSSADPQLREYYEALWAHGSLDGCPLHDEADLETDGHLH